MPCDLPMTGYRTALGGLVIGNTKPRTEAWYTPIPCGKCLQCLTARAKGWAIRCSLELQQHQHAAFATLTFNDEHLPPTLTRRAPQLFLKKLRSIATTPVRYFLSGEYGEQSNRPHYHAILYGLAERDADIVQSAWTTNGKEIGHTYTLPINAARIAYVAGYTQKKIAFQEQAKEKIDLDTGEVYTWQPPFILMSRRPGIGAHAKQWPDSWRDTAITNGYKTAVPRYLHDAWKQQATPEELHELLEQKIEHAKTTNHTRYQQEAQKQIAHKRHEMKAETRKYDK